MTLSRTQGPKSFTNCSLNCLSGTKKTEVHLYQLSEFKQTRLERLKAALYLRLKKRERLFLKKFGIFEFFSFRKCRVVPKNVKGGLFGLHQHTLCYKISKNSKGGLFSDIKKFSMSHNAEKKSKGGTL